MSRSGYNDDCEDNWALIRWRGAVNSAIRGKRGQAFLREMLDAVDALPKKELIAGELEVEGAVCAIGSVGRQRGIDMAGLDPYDCESVAGTFGISEALAREIVWQNDEACWHRESPYRRFERMRAWIISNLKGDLASGRREGTSCATACP